MSKSKTCKDCLNFYYINNTEGFCSIPIPPWMEDFSGGWEDHTLNQNAYSEEECITFTLMEGLKEE